MYSALIVIVAVISFWAGLAIGLLWRIKPCPPNPIPSEPPLRYMWIDIGGVAGAQVEFRNKDQT